MLNILFFSVVLKLQSKHLNRNSNQFRTQVPVFIIEAGVITRLS
jgi:hypothetical protein